MHERARIRKHQKRVQVSQWKKSWFDLRLQPVPEGIFILSIDITERKQAEEELKEEAILRATLVDSLPCIAMVIKKRTREIVASNKLAKEANAVPGENCYRACLQRVEPCPFCLAPKLWATNETQTLEVEYGRKCYRCIWMPYTKDLYVH